MTLPALEARWRWRTIRKTALTQIVHAGVLSSVLIGMLFGVTLLAMLIQAGRTEVLPADRIVVVVDSDPDPVLIQYVVERYRRSFAPTLIIVGTAPTQAADLLQAQGVTASSMIIAADAGLPRQIRTNLATDPNPADRRTLILAEPHQLLLPMKISRDLDFQTYGSAPPTQQFNVWAAVPAVVAYWQYVLGM